MGDDFKSWGVYSYRRQKSGKRLIATLIAKFDNAPDARKLMQDWKGSGPIYCGPCDRTAKITPAGKRRMDTHQKNIDARKTAPELDKNWQYITPTWNTPGVY